MELPGDRPGDPGSTHAEHCCFIKISDKHNVPEDRLGEVLPPNTVLYTTMEPCNERLTGNRTCVERILRLKGAVNTVYVGSGSHRRLSEKTPVRRGWRMRELRSTMLKGCLIVSWRYPWQDMRRRRQSNGYTYGSQVTGYGRRRAQLPMFRSYIMTRSFHGMFQPRYNWRTSAAIFSQSHRCSSFEEKAYDFRTSLTITCILDTYDIGTPELIGWRAYKTNPPCISFFANSARCHQV